MSAPFDKWSDEAHLLSAVLRLPPDRALARRLQHFTTFEPEELEERAPCQWEVMMQAMPRSRRESPQSFFARNAPHCAESARQYRRKALNNVS